MGRKHRNKQDKPVLVVLDTPMANLTKRGKLVNYSMETERINDWIEVHRSFYDDEYAESNDVSVSWKSIEYGCQQNL